MDALIERLGQVIHFGDWGESQSTWSRLERRLVRHLETEERFLFPALERERPDESAALQDEHTLIRRHLANMSVGVELHTLREQHVRRFIEFLQAHAAREEVLLYRRADDLPPDISGAFVRGGSGSNEAA